VITLDASALLAFLFREPGGDLVASAIKNSIMSTVNLSEVLGRFSRDGHEPALIRRRLFATAIQWVSFDAKQAEYCAQLMPLTHKQGLSLADRACLSLAMLRGIPVLTADRAWLNADLDVEIQLIR